MSSKNIDYLDLMNRTKECLNKLGLDTLETWITPVRSGYIVELQPTQDKKSVDKLAQCLKEFFNVGVFIKEYTYGSAVLIKT
ncbi:MAG: hypothetical protein QXD50_05175 [Desulfurococcaceae archaeon]